jgi:hypothetical protein
MWDWADNTVFDIIEWLPAAQTGGPEFNYFFTLVSIFGVIALAVGTLVKIITRS